MKVRLLAEARHDLKVGASFLVNLESDIESLRVYAGIHEKYRGF